MNIPKDLKYTNDHEWLKVEGNTALVGITEFAQSELGEIVFVEVDTLDEELAASEVFGTIEAVKTTSDLFMPIGGKVIEFNPEINEEDGDNPGLINQDPYGQGWIIRIEITDPSELDNLLNAVEYESLIS